LIYGGFIIDNKGHGEIWDDEGNDIFNFARDERGTFVVPADPLFFAIELGQKSALETIKAIHSDPSQTVSRQALSDFFRSELAGLSNDQRIRRYLLKAAFGGFETRFRESVENTQSLN
jgi:hypothetical protein